MNRVDESWSRAWASYDSWRLSGPPEPKYDWDDFAEYVDQNPDCGWDADSESDLESYIEMREREEAEAEGERLAEAAEHERDADDRAFWDSL